MTMKLATIKFDISAILAALGELSDGPRGVLGVDERWGNGSGGQAVQTMYYDQRSLAGGANEDIDLKTDLDGNNVALAMVEARVFIIQCPGTNSNGIQMTPSTVDGWDTFLSASGATDDPQITVQPGATVILIAPKDGSYAVAASNDSVNFLNLDGAGANTYTLMVLGTQA